MKRNNSDKKYKSVLFFLYMSIIMSPLRCYGIIIAGINFSFFRIAGILMMICWLICNREIIVNSRTKCIATILYFTLLQSSYSSQLSGSYSSFLSQLYGFVWIFFAYQIINKTKSYKGAINSIIISSVFPLLLGLYQWITYKSTGVVPRLPFSFLVSSEGKIGLTYNVYVRITSCFGDPAYMSTFFVGVFSIILHKFMSESTENGNGKIFKIAYLSIIILIILETIMAISVSGVLGLLVNLLLYLYFYIKKNKKFGKILITLSIISLGFFFYFINSGSELLYILQFKMSTGTETSTNMYGRSEYMLNALNVWLEHPFFGGGFGSLRLNNVGFSSAHSSLLTILGQQGLIVFVFNIFILIVFPLLNYKKLKKTDVNDHYSLFIGSFLGLISILILTIGYDTLYSIDSCYVLIAIVNSFDNCYLDNEI